jgi:bifunctional dethiobiotin synthetase / adenosylmethionine---8-amino-7-oxononanoate aminotransferase
MSQYLPTRNFQIYQIFAPNTNLGKTIISAGLLNAFSRSPSISHKFNRSDNSKNYNPAKRLFYVKPVQTGYPTDSDARFVKDCLDKGKHIEYKTLYEYERPVSPHLAVRGYEVSVPVKWK